LLPGWLALMMTQHLPFIESDVRQEALAG